MSNFFRLKSLFFIFLLGLLTFEIKAQTNFTFGKQYGSENEEEALNPAIDKFGNIYIAGKTDGVLGEKNYGKTDAFVSRFDSTGNLIWTKQIGSPEIDEFRWLTVDEMGCIYATGSTNGTISEKNFGKKDILVVKLDSSGNILWQKQFGTDSSEVASSICSDNQGGIYVSGATRGKFGKTVFGKADAFLMKLDNNGNIVYINQFGTSEDDDCAGIFIDPSLNIYLSGYTSGNLAEKNKGSFDAYVLILNNKSEQIKAMQFGTNNYDLAYRILVDKEKNIYVAGSTAGEFEGKQQGEGDCFLTKIKENGEIVWTRQFGTANWDGIFGIDLNEQISDNIIVSGCQNWPACQSFYRIFNKEGKLVSKGNFTAKGAGGGTCGKAVCFDKKGNIYHTGLTGGNLFNNNRGKHDIFILKMELDKNLK